MLVAGEGLGSMTGIQGVAGRRVGMRVGDRSHVWCTGEVGLMSQCIMCNGHNGDPTHGQND